MVINVIVVAVTLLMSGFVTVWLVYPLPLLDRGPQVATPGVGPTGDTIREAELKPTPGESRVQRRNAWNGLVMGLATLVEFRRLAVLRWYAWPAPGFASTAETEVSGLAAVDAAEPGENGY